jgi:D-alanine transfer protein
MFISPKVGQKAYSGDFSRLHANAMVFSPYISLGLKQRAATRMLDYPETYANDPVLSFALQKLSGHFVLDPLLYYLSVPIGDLQTQVIRLQDYWAVTSYIYSNSKDFQPIERKTYSIDWNAEMVRARNLQKVQTSTNPYGIENTHWNRSYRHMLGSQLVPGSGNGSFIQRVSESKEWEDLDILLSVLKETDAQPLILGRPLNGALWTRMGVSASARQFFYDRLQGTVQPYGFPLIDFSDQDTNRLFSIDRLSHTSRLGWIYVNQALDAFYHGIIH